MVGYFGASSGMSPRSFVEFRAGFVPAGDACQADYLVLQFQRKGHVGHVHIVHHNPLGRGIEDQRIAAIVDRNAVSGVRRWRRTAATLASARDIVSWVVPFH